jgi:hypothetical protein
MNDGQSKGRETSLLEERNIKGWWEKGQRPRDGGQREKLKPPKLEGRELYVVSSRRPIHSSSLRQPGQWEGPFHQKQPSTSFPDSPTKGGLGSSFLPFGRHTSPTVRSRKGVTRNVDTESAYAIITGGSSCGSQTRSSCCGRGPGLATRSRVPRDYRRHQLDNPPMGCPSRKGSGCKRARLGPKDWPQRAIKF